MTIYELLVASWKREKEGLQLNTMDTNFFEKCRAYINHLETQASSETDISIAKLFNNRWVRVNYLFNDLITLRLQKQFQIIINGDKSPSPIPFEEEHLRNQLINLLLTYRDEVIGIKTKIQNENDQDEGDNYELVHFSQNENLQTVGVDLRKYGPFEKGDLAIIPKENMRYFMKRSKVDHIKID